MRLGVQMTARARRIREQAYKKSKSGKVSGGPALRETAAYTYGFGIAVCEAWEKSRLTEVLPERIHDSLAALLNACGFFGALDLETPAAKLSAPRPQLRRMTYLSLER